MVSEDSDQVFPGLAPVHGFGDARDLNEPFSRQMSASLNESDATSELLEVVLLGRQHRIPFEERDDRLQQVASPSHDESIKVFPVIVSPGVRHYRSDTEELTELVETRDASSALCDRKLVSHLPAGPVAAPASSPLLANETD
jgi:hypothetical protein